MSQNFCEHCGTARSEVAKFCPACGKSLTDRADIKTAEATSNPDKAKLIGGVFGLIAFVVFLTLFANMEDHGGRMRMNVVGWLLYGIGGKFLLSAFLGGVVGFFAWLWACDKGK